MTVPQLSDHGPITDFDKVSFSLNGVTKDVGCCEPTSHGRVALAWCRVTNVVRQHT
jgi:hypothetical protein